MSFNISPEQTEVIQVIVPLVEVIHSKLYSFLLIAQTVIVSLISICIIDGCIRGIILVNF